MNLSQSPDASWRAVGAADVDGDWKTDILLQQSTTGNIAAWYLDGDVVRFGANLSPVNAGDLNWKVVGPR
jgi:hypothetical protein